MSDRPESVGLWAKFGKVQLAQQRRCGRYRGIVEKVTARLFNLAQPTQHIKKTLCVMSYEQKPTASQHFCRLSKRCSSLFWYLFPIDAESTSVYCTPTHTFSRTTRTIPNRGHIPPPPSPLSLGSHLNPPRSQRKGKTEGGSVPLPLSLSIHRFPFPFFPPLALSPRIPLLHPHASQHGMSFAKTDTAKNYRKDMDPLTLICTNFFRLPNSCRVHC